LKRIYLCEDTPEDALIATAILARLGDVEVVHFADGLAVYRAVKKAPPDLIMLDIILPTLSGLAITRLLKFDGRFEQIPILVASSIIDADIEQRARVAGANVFLHKPYDMEILQGEATRLLG
jgi:CheY-like chemotaxis protein